MQKLLTTKQTDFSYRLNDSMESASFKGRHNVSPSGGRIKEGGYSFHVKDYFFLKRLTTPNPRQRGTLIIWK